MYEPVTDRSIRLADGRAMAYAEWGDVDGPPVVFFDGTPCSRLFCPNVAATHAAGVHLITVDRPGYGRSDPPRAELTMRDWTADVVQLADHLRLDQFGVVGWSGGALYATACAAVISDRLTGGGETGGAGWPVDEQPGALAALGDAGRRVHELARTDRDAAMRLAEELNAGWITQYHVRPESILDEITVPEDRRVFDDPAWAARNFETTRDALRQGPRSYAWDSMAQLGDWGFALEDIGIDFHLWHGVHDPNESMADVEYWATRIPRARVTVWEDSGHFALVNHWGEMLADVLGDPA